MKKAKRILAVLLTAVLAFTILTGCGGGNGGNGGNGSNTSYPASSTVKNAAASTLRQAGFSASPDEQALNAISEKYAKQISMSPHSYSSYASSSLLSKIQSAWGNDCEDAFTTSKIYTLKASSPYDGSNSEADAASYYAKSLSSKISHFNQAVSSKGPGTPYYFVYPVHITNPSDSEDSVWIMFTFLYYVQN